jgi:AraC-like DNA-binding protein
MSQKRLTVADEPFYLVRSLASRFQAGHDIARHAHRWHQLIYASAGVLHVWTERGAWVVPPQRAVWVPAGLRHGIRCAGACALRFLYVDPGWEAGLPAACSAVTVSPLLRELIGRCTEIGALDWRVPAEAALALLIVTEFGSCTAPPFDLPQPDSASLRQVTALMAGAGAQMSHAALARAAGLGLRTLERRFLAETGMPLGRWRRQAALLAAMERLAAGAAVKSVAASAGYATPSAFVAAFREAFGSTPGRYFGRDVPAGL